VLSIAILIAALIAARQADRWWFSPRRNPFEPRDVSMLRHIRQLQKERANSLTPTVLVCSIWAEIGAWCFLLVWAGPLFYAVLAVIVALRFRQLQEVTHFAVHGVLTRKLAFGNVLAEAGFQIPLGLTTIPDRRRTHVREHHPNATVAGVDPNLETLAEAGLRPGVTAYRFLLATLYPLTVPGIAHAFREYMASGARGLRVSSWLARKSVPVAIALCLYLLLGWPGLVFGYVVPRFVIYPAFAWLSLLIEHRWFRRCHLVGIPAADEAARCLRLYRAQPLTLALARATWLPYGDAFHFAHSTHPAVRWNYLRALDHQLVAEVAQFRSVILGRDSVLATLYKEGSYERERALAPSAAAA